MLIVSAAFVTEGCASSDDIDNIDTKDGNSSAPNETRGPKGNSCDEVCQVDRANNQFHIKKP